MNFTQTKIIWKFQNEDPKQEIIASCSNKNNNKQTSSPKIWLSKCQALILGKSDFYAKKCFWVFRKSDRGNAKRRQGDVFQVKNNSLTSDYGTICVSTETFSYEFIGLTIML